MTNEQLDDLVEEWHNLPHEDLRSLHDYLGMTWQEYNFWVMYASIPQSYLDRHQSLM